MVYLIVYSTLLCNGTWYGWFTSLNPIEIVISAIVGVLIALFVGLVHAGYIQRANDKKLRDKFSPIAGRFTRYFKNSNRLLATAVIEYIDQNQLRIEVTTLININTGADFSLDEMEIWTGEITMDSQKSGFIVWEYRQPQRYIDMSEKGFKRIIVDSDLNGITLVGAKEYGYGKESFKREPIATNPV